MTATAPRGRSSGDWLRDALPKLVLSPSLAMVLVFVYGFILFTFFLSFTDSRILPSFNWVGLENYQKLFGLRSWGIAVNNLLVFGSLYIVICCVLGLGLVIGSLVALDLRLLGFARDIPAPAAERFLRRIAIGGLLVAVLSPPPVSV